MVSYVGCGLHTWLGSFCVLTAVKPGAKIWCQWSAFMRPSGLGCCLFEGGGSVVVDSLFIVATVVRFLCFLILLMSLRLAVMGWSVVIDPCILLTV